MYTDVARDLDTFNIVLPYTIVPIPKENDYGVGFIRRYFAQKANDNNGHIFEISYDTYNDLLNNTLWSCVDLKWRINGPIDITYKIDGGIDDVGVRNANKASIASASKKLKNIGLYLPNLFQFYK